MKKSGFNIVEIFKGLTFFLVSLLVVLSCKGKAVPEDDAEGFLIPVQVVDSMNIINTTNGVLESRMEATVMERYETDTLSFDLFKNGFAVYSYNEEGRLETVISANTARHYKYSDNTEKWEAFGNVVVKNIIKNETMETDTIYWNRSEEKIYTHRYVKMYSKDGFMQGYGMQSDQRARNSVILKPFDNYGYIIQDTTKVIIDSVNFIGPMPEKRK